MLYFDVTIHYDEKFETYFYTISVFQAPSMHLWQQTMQYFTNPTVCQAIRIGYGYDASAL